MRGGEVTALPASLVVLHHARPPLELETARQGAGEASERLPVAVADEEPALLPAPFALGTELDPRAVVEGDRVEALEADRAGLERLAVHPNRPLRAVWRGVDCPPPAPPPPAPPRGAA